jgi:ABC-type transporter Mla MlaB component
MDKSEFRVRMNGRVSIVEVLGPLDEAAAAHLLEFAAAAATACPAVQIDLDGVDSITQEAAALLLFRDAPWRTLSERITLRASGRPGRQAVLRAYARRRARSQTA